MTHEPQRGTNDRPTGPRKEDERGGVVSGSWLIEESELADADQTTSEADQTVSDADQTASDADQAQSESDQLAADRDQAAADRDLAQHPDSDSMEGYRRSRAERNVGERQRLTGTMIRLRTAAARDEVAALRDASADRRDLAASARDRLSSSLELEAAKAAHALGPNQNETLRHALAMAATARQNAAADRERAATDRKRAAADRKRAASDRADATLELQAAHIDELTGVYRRGIGEAILRHELLRAARAGDPLTVAFVDVDRLKEVNDSDGYAAGDKVLQDVAGALTSTLRPYDPVVRTGGDEFVCAMPGVGIDLARERFTEMGEALAARSVTFGLTAALPDDTVESVIERSSAAMRGTRRPSKRLPPS
jgi:diguanylate cyclase (GGDEF)-like protein